MDANEVTSKSVVLFPCEYDVKEGSTQIVEAVPCEDDEGFKK